VLSSRDLFIFLVFPLFIPIFTRDYKLRERKVKTLTRN